jgi:hypothetical protein
MGRDSAGEEGRAARRPRPALGPDREGLRLSAGLAGEVLGSEAAPCAAPLPRRCCCCLLGGAQVPAHGPRQPARGPRAPARGPRWPMSGPWSPASPGPCRRGRGCRAAQASRGRWGGGPGPPVLSGARYWPDLSLRALRAPGSRAAPRPRPGREIPGTTRGDASRRPGARRPGSSWGWCAPSAGGWQVGRSPQEGEGRAAPAGGLSRCCLSAPRGRQGLYCNLWIGPRQRPSFKKNNLTRNMPTLYYAFTLFLETLLVRQPYQAVSNSSHGEAI